MADNFREFYSGGNANNNANNNSSSSGKKEKKKYKGWEGKLIPKALIEATFFADERAKIDEAQAVCDETQGKFFDGYLLLGVGICVIYMIAAELLV